MYIFEIKAFPVPSSASSLVPVVRVTSTVFESEIFCLSRGITAALAINPPTHDTFVGADPSISYQVNLVAWKMENGEQCSWVSTPICTLKPKKPTRTVVMVSVDDLGATVGCNDPNAIIVTDDGAETEAFDKKFKRMKRVVDPFNPGDRLFMI